jgi:arylsulfatase A-like enzyme
MFAESFVKWLLISALLVGICEACDHGSPRPQRMARDLSFDSALTGKGIRTQYGEIGPEERWCLVPLAGESLLDRRFSSEPFDVDRPALLTGALAMKSFGLEVLPADRPVFLLRARGPEGAVQLLEKRAGVDFAPDQWLPYRVELPATIGSPVILDFSVEYPPEADSLTQMATPIWAQPRLLDSGNVERPNVLLIVFDTLRADRTGIYGYPRETTPFLDQLATRGVVVEDVIAPYPTTLTSHWSLFSGLHPPRHGIYPDTKEKQRPEQTLAGIFQSAGYLTAAFTEGGYVHSMFGFGKGFDFYNNGRDREINRFSGGAEVTFALAEQWLRENRDSRFFMFLHTYQVHAPFDPPDGYLRMFEGDYSGRWEHSYPAEAAFLVNQGKASLTPKEVDHIRSLYDAEIRYLDDTFARLWNRLKQMGALENTLVIITSDHGEDLGEHGWFHHGTTLYDPALRVPLLLVWPGQVPRGARLTCQRSLTDLMPTVLELVGLEASGRLDGVSFASEIRSGSCPQSRPAYAELISPTYKSHDDLPLAGVRDEGWKFITHTQTGAHEIYDLSRDRNETRNLVSHEPERIERMRQKVEDYLAKRVEPLEPQGEMSPEMKRQLRGLGYVE